MEESNIPKDIEEELLRLAHYNRMHFYTHFWNISKEHQNLHEQYLAEASELFEPTSEWQDEKYYELGNKSQESGYIAIVFAVMFIEGAVYNFGAIYLGDSYIRNNLDRLSLLSKISVIMRMVTGKDIDSDGQAYEHLKKLLRYRNALVHAKSSPIPTAHELMLIQEKSSKEYYEAIESAKKAIEYLNDESKKLNDDPYFPGIFGHF